MQQPNWLDNKYAQQLANATGKQALDTLSKDARLIKDVSDALAVHDVNCKKPGWAGSSRTQVIRDALATTLQSIS